MDKYFSGRRIFDVKLEHEPTLGVESLTVKLEYEPTLSGGSTDHLSSGLHEFSVIEHGLGHHPTRLLSACSTFSRELGKICGRMYG
jgi:hypothetical protein